MKKANILAALIAAAFVGLAVLIILSIEDNPPAPYTQPSIRLENRPEF